MILVTGGTGFIGKALIRRLIENDYRVRVLIRPSSHSPDLPRGISVEVAVSSFNDRRGVRAAMVGIDTIYHLATSEWRGVKADLLNVDILSTQVISQAAVEAGINRILYVSHLGADRASAYPLLKAKAIAEEYLRRSNVNHTILRSGIVFGQNDHFISGLAQLVATFPLFFLVPGDGKTLLQPLWVEDLATCLVWALENKNTINQTFSIGGPEFLSFQTIIQTILRKIDIERRLVKVDPPYMRALTVLLETILPGFPTSGFWLDYLATNRTGGLDVIPRIFNLMPSRFAYCLDYLKDQHYRSPGIRWLFQRKK